MNDLRARQLNTHTYTKGAVLYWMDRDMRLRDNWALVWAAKEAKEKQVPFGIVYNLVASYEGGGARQLEFKRQGLREIEKDAREKNIPFYIITDAVEQALPELLTQLGVGLLVTDFNPLRVSMSWKSHIAREITIPFWQVDTHNVIPCWIASPKQEFAAHTFRSKFKKQILPFLDHFPAIVHQDLSWKHFPSTHWKSIDALEANPNSAPVDWIEGGEHAAHNMLQSFLRTRIHGYATRRNDPNEHALSNLSPFLHYGMISAQRIAQSILKKKKEGTIPRADADVFLEELLVRRELADNFCFYNTSYDRVEGFPAWAQKSLAAHAKDKRPFTYTRAQFEQAATHDPLWNAAQQELVQTGKMHGYMRMYWAKKILEWTKSPKEALRIAIYLNDLYELDGRDPNGYVGCAWSIGGVHDRPWFERPIFGQIRYMNAAGCARKFDTKAYIARINRLH